MPNGILVIGDDMPKSTLIAMPNLTGDINWAEYVNGYSTRDLCRPERGGALLTAQIKAHPIINNTAGNYDFYRLNTVLHWMQAAGKRTIFIGKYLNGWDGESVLGADYSLVYGGGVGVNPDYDIGTIYENGSPLVQSGLYSAASPIISSDPA